MSKIVTSIKESYEEMRYKVSWPGFKELQSSSVLVLIGSLLFALLIGAMDTVFNELMTEVYSWF